MSTLNLNDPLSSALFGKTRIAVLSLLYGHVDETFYLRQIVRTTGSGLGAVQREVAHLTKAGIVKRMLRGSQVYYQANPQCAIFDDLKRLITKTSGMGDILRSALEPLSDHIRVAFIYGSVARSQVRNISDVDLMVIGDTTFQEVVSALSPAQETISREINPTVYPPSEFRKKLLAGHHFLQTVMSGSKLFIKGDQRELTRMVKE